AYWWLASATPVPQVARKREQRGSIASDPGARVGRRGLGVRRGGSCPAGTAAPSLHAPAAEARARARGAGGLGAGAARGSWAPAKAVRREAACVPQGHLRATGVVWNL